MSYSEKFSPLRDSTKKSPSIPGERPLIPTNLLPHHPLFYEAKRMMLESQKRIKEAGLKADSQKANVHQKTLSRLYENNFLTAAQKVFWDSKITHLSNKNIPPQSGQYFANKAERMKNPNSFKTMNELSFEEAKWLATRVFGGWPATDLLIKIDGGTGAAIKRMLALGWHEWRLSFGRQNPDPQSGFNIGTFQIGGSKTSRAQSMQKFNSVYNAGVRLAQSFGITAPPMNLANPAQRDLLAHLGYIQSQRGGNATFAKLRDPNLRPNEVVQLMSRKIQWWIPAIGRSVVAQMNNYIDIRNLA